MDTIENIEKALRADIEGLRSQYTETQDLYREVCVLMFFRYGLTPTANKLYQFVRKGSMSAPAEALNRFWENLREKSRVTIEQPDLPDPLKVAAGELVVTLWQSAQAAAHEQFSSLRGEAQSRAILAEEAVAKAASNLDQAHAQLAVSQNELRQAHEQLDVMRHEITSLNSTKLALENQLQSARAEQVVSQARLDACRVDFAAELEKIRQSAKQSEERLAGAEARALVEIDRERMSAAKAGKALEAALAERSAADGRYRAEAMALTKQLASQGHRNGIQEGELRTMAAIQTSANAEIDRLRAQLAAAGTEIALLQARTSTHGGAKMGPTTSQKQVAAGKKAPTRKRTKNSEKLG
jgi:hypothetical protein